MVDPDEEPGIRRQMVSAVLSTIFYLGMFRPKPHTVPGLCFQASYSARPLVCTEH